MRGGEKLAAHVQRFRCEVSWMVKYILKRLLQTILVLWLVLTLVFVLMRMVGDPSKLLISPESTFESLENIRHILGLDKPILEQYLDYLKSVLTWDFGNSFFYNRPVMDMIAEHMPATLLLAGTAFILAIPLALVSGAIAAIKRNSLLDNLVTFITIAGRSVPAFWLGLILILLFSVRLQWLPASGYGSFSQLILPALTLAAGMAASTARLTRSSMLEVMRQDYMTTARAKGVSELQVNVRHGMRNALLSVVTMLGLQIGHLLGGSVVVESVFAWPGVGRLMVSSIQQYDYPLVQACVLVMALLFAVINFVVDMLYMLIDPRISYQGKG